LPIHSHPHVQRHKANFPTALLHAISINTSLPKSLSQITQTLPSLSPVSPVQLPVACPCDYLIVKNSGYPSSQLVKSILLTMNINVCDFKTVNHRN